MTTKHDDFLTELNWRIISIKEDIKGNLRWVNSTSQKIADTLKRKDEDIHLNSLGEFQRTAVAVDRDISVLMTLLEIKKTYLQRK